MFNSLIYSIQPSLSSFCYTSNDDLTAANRNTTPITILDSEFYKNTSIKWDDESDPSN
jgi:hypothetical protein